MQNLSSYQPNANTIQTEKQSIINRLLQIMKNCTFFSDVVSEI